MGGAVALYVIEKRIVLRLLDPGVETRLLVLDVLTSLCMSK